MASSESEAVRDMYLGWTAARIKGEQPDPESWGNLTAEPGAVDYVEVEIGGMRAMWALPRERADDRVLLWFHGGGFIGGSIYTHRKLCGHLAKAIGARVLNFGYRLLPAGVHPAPVDDAIVAYRWLLDQGFDPARIAVGGDSSGGGLAITAQLRAGELGLPLPAAALLMSPWVDMEVSTESFRSNWAKDAFFYRELVLALAQAFLGPDGDPRDPLANPLCADLTGVAPAYIQVGGDETLLDEGRKLAERLVTAGVEVEFDVFDEQQHTFQMAAGKAPEADDAIRKLAEWARPRLGLKNRAPAAVGA
jgi:monoterpene epsilon-lactone hydrolase